MQLFRRRREYFCSVIRQEHEILHAHTARSWQIHAGLNAEYHARLQHVHAARRRDPWRLVNLQADAMTRAVYELVAVPRRLDHATGDRIDLSTRHARSDSGFGLGLSVDYDLPDLVQRGRN